MIDVREEQIKLLCKQLKLPAFANYADILRQSKPNADFSDLLLDLLVAETNARQENKNRRRLKAAGFPFQKTLDEFDFSWLNPSVSSVFIQELASCKFIDDRKNIVMIGNPSRGKTHISIAIGLKACLQGYRVLFKNAGTLATELAEARDAYQLGKIERQMEKTDLLILDELSYMSFNKYESELLFKVISERSERSSTIVTTNLPFSKWTELFESATMVSALVDRLTYKSHVLDMSGPSYRLRTSQSELSGEFEANDQ
jgi:DNA replication protein DnaC